jgi:L-aminopeptidase/D-esterase-like protein
LHANAERVLNGKAANAMSSLWKSTPAGKLRGRGLRLPLPGLPGEANAITDVPGVEVGFTTVIAGDGQLVVGKGPVRTGITAILPRGRSGIGLPCVAGSAVLNGNGELTGLAWVEESGQAEGPITITNTHAVGLARDTTAKWLVREMVATTQAWGLPIAGETYDGELNDINGFHLKEEHVFAALDGARGGAIELGSVGGGTGMISYDFKGGSGSSSRRCETAGATYTVGVFVQANFGIRPELMVLGVPVGQHIKGGEVRSTPMGSIIAVAITDAPLLPHQMKRIARRIPLGMARTGAIAHNGSGDIFIALSTANGEALAAGEDVRSMHFVTNEAMDPLFAATVEATEEAILDAMIANETMTGANGVIVRALPHGDLVDLMKRYGRM